MGHALDRSQDSSDRGRTFHEEITTESLRLPRNAFPGQEMLYQATAPLLIEGFYKYSSTFKSSTNIDPTLGKKAGASDCRVFGRLHRAECERVVTISLHPALRMTAFHRREWECRGQIHAYRHAGVGKAMYPHYI
jgi:hypothetical protein